MLNNINISNLYIVKLEKPVVLSYQYKGQNITFSTKNIVKFSDFSKAAITYQGKRYGLELPYQFSNKHPLSMKFNPFVDIYNILGIFLRMYKNFDDINNVLVQYASFFGKDITEFPVNIDINNELYYHFYFDVDANVKLDSFIDFTLSKYNILKNIFTSEPIYTISEYRISQTLAFTRMQPNYSKLMKYYEDQISMRDMFKYLPEGHTSQVGMGGHKTELTARKIDSNIITEWGSFYYQIGYLSTITTLTPTLQEFYNTRNQFVQDVFKALQDNTYKKTGNIEKYQKLLSYYIW